MAIHLVAMDAVQAGVRLRRGQSMDHPNCPESPAESWPDGPVVLGPAGLFRSIWSVRPPVSQRLQAASDLFVRGSSQLPAEWEPAGSRVAASLDPAANEEMQLPSGRVLQRLEAFLGPPVAEWSFRVLNGRLFLTLSPPAKPGGILPRRARRR